MLRTILLASVVLRAWTLAVTSESDDYALLARDRSHTNRKTDSITTIMKPSLSRHLDMTWERRHRQLDRRKYADSSIETREHQSTLTKRSPVRRSGKSSKPRQDPYTTQGRHPSLLSSTLTQTNPKTSIVSRSGSSKTSPRDREAPSTPPRQQHAGPIRDSKIPRAPLKPDRQVGGSNSPPTPRKSPNEDSAASDSSARLETPRMSRAPVSRSPPTNKEEDPGKREIPPIRRFMSSRMSTSTGSIEPGKIEDKPSATKPTSTATQSTMASLRESSEQAGPSSPPPLHASSVVGIPTSLSRIKITGDTTGGVYKQLELEAMAGDENNGVTFSSGREPDRPPRGPRPPGLPKGPSAPAIPRRPPEI